VQTTASRNAYRADARQLPFPCAHSSEIAKLCHI